MKALRIAVATLGLMGLSVASAIGMVAVHADTDFGREALRQAFVAYSSDRHRGTVELDSIEEIGFDRWVLKGYRVTAPSGTQVLDTPELEGRWDVDALLDGRIRFRPAWFRDATIRLTPGPEGQVELVHALQVPDDRFFVPMRFDDVRIEGNTIHVALPGKPEVTMREVRGLATLEVGHRFYWRMDRHRGVVDLPIAEVGFSKMEGRLRSDHAHPLVGSMVLDLEVAEPGMELDYHAPAVVGRDGEAQLEMDLPVQVAGLSGER